MSALPVFAEEDVQDVPAPNWTYVQAKMKKAGFKPSFIKALKKMYDPSDFQSVLELNCLLFLRKSDYHTTQVSQKAVEDVRRFMQENEGSLHKAEKKYGVSPAAVSGLLWLESRYGENTGRFHVPSAFIDLLQADRPQAIAHLKLAASPKFTKRLSIRVAREITKKAKAKSKWALDELKSLERMYAKNHKIVRELKGSFAGAFGMPQFLPSSYMSYARPSKNGNAPDLNSASDAIQSVAYYLKKNGWRKRDEKTYEKALLKYNNSHDYARAILELAEQAGDSDSREPATTKPKLRKKKRKKR